MRSKLVAIVFASWLFTLATAFAGQSPPTPKDHNVILVLVDGLRWQEVFSGAEEALMNKANGGVASVEKLRASLWRETPEARRESLMPFLWTTVAKQGQLFGNQNAGSVMKVSNNFHFSYPGYSEMTVGFADPRINSNNPNPNPNETVFEWLNKKPTFRGKVAAFGAWDVVPAILNRERCGFYINAALEPVTQGRVSPEQELLNKLKAELPHPWGGEPYDAITFRAALEYIKANCPRVFWLTFGETDEFAHEGRYDHYLQAAHRTDGFLKTLWDTIQQIPQYRDRTTLIVAPDHGRGDGPKGWTSHGISYKGSDNIWLAIIGPLTPALGERLNIPPVWQSQIAATVAASVGEDYAAAVPKADKPIEGALRLTKPGAK